MANYWLIFNYHDISIKGFFNCTIVAYEEWNREHELIFQGTSAEIVKFFLLQLSACDYCLVLLKGQSSK